VETRVVDHPGRAELSRDVLISVAIGGVIGATARWGLGAIWTHHAGQWPWSTLTVNIIGCFAIGFMARRLAVGTVAWAFVVTGVLGGFTTYSAFAVELSQLVDADRAGLAAAYAGITLIGGVTATALAGGRAAAPSAGAEIDA
jgi:CrcB protein